MNVLVAVGLGGAIGSVLRYGLSTAVHRLAATAFPIGTLLVNVLGSFAIGLLHVWLVERAGARPELRAFLMAGVLGGFTTFSTFSLETLGLMMRASYGQALLNVAVSVVLCLGGALLGMVLARQIG